MGLLGRTKGCLPLKQTVRHLPELGMQFGWFYDGHRAMADCEACLALLAQTLPKSDRRIMAAVAASDPVADEMLAATELTIKDLSSRIGGQPRLKKYRKILRDVVKELNGQGTNPNLLLDLETLT